MIAEVVVDVMHSNVDRIYDYIIPEHVTHSTVGYRVVVNFGGRKTFGIIINEKSHSDCPIEKLKLIIEFIDECPVLSDEMISLMWYIKKYNYMNLASSLRLFIPPELRNNTVSDKYISYVSLKKQDFEFTGKSKKQQDAISYMQVNNFVAKKDFTEKFSISILNSLVSKGFLEIQHEKQNRIPYKQLDSTLIKNQDFSLTIEQLDVIESFNRSENNLFLLHGVTGSGKTEVYLQLISDCIARNKTAIMLVPEISLTPQMLLQFRNRFLDKVAILHSGLSAGERFDEWWKILKGDAKIVVGARSAIFAPIKDIGIIIIDEEHEQSYIPDSSKFVTSDVAEFRTRYNQDCKLLLGSATPSVCTYYKITTSKYQLLNLENRINKKPLPKIDIVDMKKELFAGNNSIFSRLLKSKLDECISQNNQAMLFINRRGFSSIVMCKECGYVAKCKDCDISLTYHKDEDVLKCHYCGNKYKMLNACPECGSEQIRQKGLGTEKVCELLQEMYPNVGILRMDNDTTSGKEGHLKIIQKFASKQANILVGTQMIAKGHDFKDVSLVGILDADLSLYFADYRSIERTFQLITQVAGRAGRADLEGSVVLQTYSPNHYVYNIAKQYDYKKFYNREIDLRKATNYPPFSDIVRVVFLGENEEYVLQNMKSMFFECVKIKEKYESEFIFFNKMKSPIKRLQKKYRYQILIRLKCDKSDTIIDEINCLLNKNKHTKVTSYIEVNPINMS